MRPDRVSEFSFYSNLFEHAFKKEAKHWKLFKSTTLEIRTSFSPEDSGYSCTKVRGRPMVQSVPYTAAMEVPSVESTPNCGLPTSLGLVKLAI
jgi:hypothetical protein